MWELSPFQVTLERKWEVRGRRQASSALKTTSRTLGKKPRALEVEPVRMRIYVRILLTKRRNRQDGIEERCVQ